MHALPQSPGTRVGGGELQLSTDRRCLSSSSIQPWPCPVGPPPPPPSSPHWPPLALTLSQAFEALHHPPRAPPALAWKISAPRHCLTQMRMVSLIWAWGLGPHRSRVPQTLPVFWVRQVRRPWTWLETGPQPQRRWMRYHIMSVRVWAWFCLSCGTLFPP